MEYLLENGISKEVFENLKETCDDFKTNIIETNEDRIVDVINYLRDFGIQNEKIEELLFMNIDFFLKKISDIESVFNKYNKDEIVKLLNTDIDLINRIF